MKYYTPLATIVLVFCLYACKKDPAAPVNPPPGGSLPAAALAPYPFGIGREWHYEVNTFISLGSSQSSNDYKTVYKHIKDTVINGETAHVLYITSLNLADSSMTDGYRYYVNRTDGLYNVAYTGFPTHTLNFRTSGSFNDLVKKQLIENDLLLRTDSISLFDTSLRLTQLPVHIDSLWRSYHIQPVFNFKRQWIGSSYISVPAGTFFCIRLAHFMDANNDNVNDHPTDEAYQFFSAKGLIKTTTHSDLVAGGGQTGISTTKAELTYTNF